MDNRQEIINYILRTLADMQLTEESDDEDCTECENLDTLQGLIEKARSVVGGIEMPKDKTQDDKEALPFIVAILDEPENLLFGFPTREKRDDFVKALKEKWPHVKYATSDITVDKS